MLDALSVERGSQVSTDSSRSSFDHTDDDATWTRVKGRLLTNVGDDVFNSWFKSMNLESVGAGIAHLSVPTRFLKSWIVNHYADRVLSCWQAEIPTLIRVDLTVRSPMHKAQPKLDTMQRKELQADSSALALQLHKPRQRNTSKTLLNLHLSIAE